MAGRDENRTGGADAGCSERGASSWPSWGSPRVPVKVEARLPGGTGAGKVGRGSDEFADMPI
jgi:hypothetical protein